MSSTNTALVSRVFIIFCRALYDYLSKNKSCTLVHGLMGWTMTSVDINSKKAQDSVLWHYWMWQVPNMLSCKSLMYVHVVTCTTYSKCMWLAIFVGFFCSGVPLNSITVNMYLKTLPQVSSQSCPFSIILHFLNKFDLLVKIIIWPWTFTLT